LYDLVETEAKSRGLKEVMLDVFTVNKTSHDFHTRIGYQPLLQLYTKKIS